MGKILKERRAYNVENKIPSSENRVIDRLLARFVEKEFVHDELAGKINEYQQQNFWDVFLQLQPIGTLMHLRH